jgi:hypothetical protein
MFNQLFFRSEALTRELSAPLVDERRQYLAHCAAQGMSKCTVRRLPKLYQNPIQLRFRGLLRARSRFPEIVGNIKKVE